MHGAAKYNSFPIREIVYQLAELPVPEWMSPRELSIRIPCAAEAPGTHFHTLPHYARS